jgi:glycosyltransferase involved in cell wall biosynthesis
MSAIWVTWEIQRRNRSLARALGAELHEMIHRGGALARYCALSWRTFRLVRRRKPQIIYYQNPSLILSAFLATLKFLRLTRAKLVGDFHNAGVDPPVMPWLVPWIVRHTELVIVSNANLEPTIRALGGRSMSVPDPIPELHARTDAGEARSGFEVFFVCSWAPDEPIAEVLKAAALLQAKLPGVTVAITGRPKLEKIGWTEPVPANVTLTGFLSEAEFEQRLVSADVVLDLTTRADCMVCGAYEATSAEVPMVLSDNPPTRGYFRKGARFTDNSAASIAQEILAVHARHAEMRAEVSALKHELLVEEKAKLAELADRIRAKR